MKTYSKILTKNFLYKEYIVNKKTILQIAKQAGCGSTTLRDYLIKQGIPIRSKSEAMQGSNNKYHHILTKEFLIKEYTKNKKSIKTIADEIGSSCKPVYMALKRNGIEIRSKFEQNYGKNNGYWRDGISSKQHFCIDCGDPINLSTVYRGSRCKSCARKEEYKDPTNHPGYIDGSSFEPYPTAFNNFLKESIRKRDNYTCKKCGITEEEHLTVYGLVLSVHHINYNKQNCEETNLITLCRECNTRVNFNRGYWTSYFQNKIKVFA